MIAEGTRAAPSRRLPRAVPVVTPWVCILPATATRTHAPPSNGAGLLPGTGHVLRPRCPAEHGQPHAGPAAAVRSGEAQPGRGDATSCPPASETFRGRRGSLRGDCEEASCAGGHPAAKPLLRGAHHSPSAAPGRKLLPCCGSFVFCFSHCPREGMSNAAFLGCCRQRADLTGSKFPGTSQRRFEDAALSLRKRCQPVASESQGCPWLPVLGLQQQGAPLGRPMGEGGQGAAPSAPAPFAGTLLPEEGQGKRTRVCVRPLGKRVGFTLDGSSPKAVFPASG